jgi:hypothetical protein
LLVAEEDEQKAPSKQAKTGQSPGTGTPAERPARQKAPPVVTDVRKPSMMASKKAVLSSPITQPPSPHKFPPNSWIIPDCNKDVAKLPDLSPAVARAVRKLPQTSWMAGRHNDIKLEDVAMERKEDSSKFRNGNESEVAKSH